MKGTINATLPDAKISYSQMKEQREHYTIVDLMRNDLSMVAEHIKWKISLYRSHQNPERRNTANQFWNCGKLNENWQNQIGDILATLLPAGSIGGAPKEKNHTNYSASRKTKRGYYTEFLAYLMAKHWQSAVAIRFISQVDENLYFHSGGGITIHSNVQDEYEELLEKVYLPIEGAD